MSTEVIVSVATDLVAESGLTGFSMDEVARRAHVSKSTIYRRWPSRDDLVIEVCSQVRDFGTDADTGSVVDDARSILDGLRRAFASPRLSPVFLAVAEAAGRDPAIARLQRQISAGARARLEDAVRRGVERGELDRSTDVGLTAELLAGPLFYRRFFKRSPITTADVDRLCRTVLA